MVCLGASSQDSGPDDRPLTRRRGLMFGSPETASDPMIATVSETSPSNPTTIPTRQHVYDDAGRTAVWGLGVNLLLVIIKVTGGVLTGSAALLADAVNSIGDVGSALAVRGALHIAQ